jgi:hypothetical protein
MSYQRISIVDENGSHIADSSITIGAGESKTVTVTYASDDAGTTGIGFTVDYGSQLDGSVTLLHTADNIAGGDAIEAEGLTVHSFGYASLFGAFPGSSDVNLAAITLTNNGDSSVSVPLYLTFTSSHAGYDEINDNPEPLPALEIITHNIDENSGENQVIAYFDPVEGIAYSLTDNTNYGGGAAAVDSIVAPSDTASIQNVYIKDGEFSADGTQLTLTVAYSSDSSTTGVGFTIDYDAAKFGNPSVELITAADNIAGGAATTADGITSLVFGYASLFGAFPAENDLATITLDILASGPADIDVTATSGMAGYALNTQGVSVQLPAISPLSLDAAGNITLSVNPDFESVPTYSFDISSDAGQSGSATVSIGNVDEIAPTITSGDTAVAIDENSGAGQVVYTATADDSADMSVGVTFSLSGTDADAFSIDSASGAVTLTANPDYEAQSSYSFTVVASDGVNAAAEQSVSLAINIVDTLRPVISSSADAGSIEENSGAGQVVYTAVASDETSSVTYSLSGADADAFSIDSVNGAVTLTGNPDYESQSSFSFDVVATDDAGNASQQTVSLSVTDVLETNPVFANTPDPVIDENTVFAYTAEASIESNAVLTYSLSNDFGGVFSIDSATGVVSMSVTPDYEAGEDYSFTVVVADANGNSSEKTVSLTINNVDDTAPVFSQNTVSVDITEDTGANQVVYTANADDSADMSDGVSYSFYRQADSFNAPVLSEDTQHLYISEAILSDNDSMLSATLSYNSLVTETSGLGLRIHYDSSALTLNSISDVLSADLIFTNVQPTADTSDLDNNANTDHFVDAGWASLYGNWPNGNLPTELLTLNFDIDPSAASSTDIGVSASSSPVGLSFDGHVQTVSISSSAGNTQGGLSIDASSGEVTLLDNPSNETTPEYNFSILATDAAGNLSDPQLVNIEVNDEPLAISSSDTTIVVNENIGAGQPVYSTTVSGAEVGDEITYRLLTSEVQQSGGIEQRFVNNQDGSITLQLYVSPSIVGNYPSSIENIDLVISYNASEIDTPEVSLPAETEMSVIEETVVGEIKIAGIFLNDLPDIVNNPLAELKFNYKQDIASTEFTVSDVILGFDTVALEQSVSQYFDSRGFSIDENTGVVSLIENPDHEAQTDYIFTVMASDAASGQSDIQTVRLSVNDLDDAQPEITSSNVVDAIDENSGAGQVIYTATASDTNDISDGFSFSLVEGSDPALTIDATTGEVSLTTDPNFEVQSQYNFTIVATDVAGNTSVAKSLSLEVNNLDDTAPTITNDVTALAIDENSGSGQVIYTATAYDSSDVSDGYVFSFVEGSDPGLSLDANTGEVSLVADPDYEVQSQYSFAIVATDAAGNASETQSVTLDINNLDDTAAIITSDNTVAAIDENSGAGQVIYTATADDSSDVSNGFSFSLAEGSDAALTIDVNTGEVSLTPNPDHEVQSQYSFAVIVTDAAGNVSATESMTLNINNLDEIAPTITSADAVPAIDENSGAGKVIYTATVDDSADISAGVTFSLAEGSDAGLTIDSSTGEVSLTADPDYELQAQYSFTVIASDVAGNTSTTQLITLDINDLDDFSLAGKVYHWGTQAVLDDVSITMSHSDSMELIETVSSSADGDYIIDELAANQVVVNVEKDMQDEGRLVTALDALAALKIVVGINPNPMDDSNTEQLNISPYQFIAADVNQSGEVTSLDVLEILKMAVRMPTAIEKEWLFVNESEDFWDETANNGQGELSISRTSVSWDSEGVEMYVDQAEEMNFVGVMLGDVYSSWSAPAGTDVIEHEHFIELEDAGTAPMYQWGMSPQPFSIKSAVSAEGIVEKSGAGQVVYTIKSSDYAATYSLGESSDSALFTVDANTGEVSLIENPDFDVKDSYSFEVIATSSDGESLSQMVSLAISERDPNIPVFESGDTATAIDENSGENQVVYTAVAENIDTGLVSGPITYSLTDDANGAFAIDATTGAVTLVNNPDADTSASLSFTVSAVNAENNSAQQVVTLAINDLDDTAPVMVSGGSASVDENTGANQVVYTANADDSADVSSGDLVYSMVDNSVVASQITIPELVADTQHVYVSESTKSVDASQETVVISYNSDNSDSTGLGVQIHFNSNELSVDSLFDVLTADNIFAFDTPIADTDDNDNDASTDMYLSLAWASMNGTWPGSIPTELASVTFDILDSSIDSSTINLATSGNAAGYNYDGQSHDVAIASGVSSLAIDSETGEVTLAVDPDFEARPEYSFDITATDSAGNVSDTQSVTLSVNDIDESPRITSDDIEVIIQGSGSDQAVYTATTNIAGASFSLVDNTVYPAVASNAEPAVTVISVPEVLASTQHVYISDSQISDDGTQVAVTFTYLADSDSLTGVGMSVNFDSSQLSVSEISNVLTGAIASGGQSQDVDNLDANENTDQLLSFGWASLFGGWPGSSRVDLATVTFDIADGATDYADINIVKTSTAAGYSFAGQSQQIAVVTGASDAPVSNVTTPTVEAGTQHVYVSQSTKSENGSQVELVISYSADVNGTTGVGFNVDFDSSEFAVNNVELITSSDNIADGTVSSENGTTSLTFAYASLFGAFPGSSTVEIARITLDVLVDTSADISITEVSSSAIHEFVGHSHTVEAAALPETETMASQLSIDSATGVVTLAGEADYQTVSDYNFTVTADNGTEIVNQTVGLVVADQEVSSDSDAYTGTDGVDVFALTDGSAQVASGAGADVFVVGQTAHEWDSADMHMLVDFESGVDSIDFSAVLVAAGYSSGDSLTQLSSADMSADILDLINNDDSSLDNMFGGSFDDTSNVLTLFADTNSAQGSTSVSSLQIELDENATVDDDDITVSFIA